MKISIEYHLNVGFFYLFQNVGIYKTLEIIKFNAYLSANNFTKNGKLAVKKSLMLKICNVKFYTPCPWLFDA